MELRRFDYTLKSAFLAKHVGAKIVFAHPGARPLGYGHVKTVSSLIHKACSPPAHPKATEFPSLETH